jgi:diadenosine tetraphosphatase ApaH/serine/threonine PP2A family protein phosphatase
MRLALFSDVHGNLEALEAVFADMDNQNINERFFLGDAIGYGANPLECLDFIYSRAQVVIMGNHDYAALDSEELKTLNPEALYCMLWTIPLLGRGHRSMIGQAVRAHTENGMCVTHGSPDSQNPWGYVMTAMEARAAFESSAGTVTFVGHSHIPAAFFESTNQRTFGGQARVVQEAGPARVCVSGGRYVINVGSVGQPRDGDPRASYGIFETDERVYELRRVPYDVTAAAEKIRAAGLPDTVAGRLVKGK